MQSRKCFRLFLLALFVSGCASVKAPEKWLPIAQKVPEDPYGSWIEVSCKDSQKGKVNTSGELIAVEGDTLFVLSDSLSAVYIPDIAAARLVEYEAQKGTPAILTVLGGLSTLSHGMLLIFTFPAWIIAGSTATAARSFDPITDYPDDEIARLVQYSRFPQGLPLHLDRKNIRPKNWVQKKMPQERKRK